MGRSWGHTKTVFACGARRPICCTTVVRGKQKPILIQQGETGEGGGAEKRIELSTRHTLPRERGAKESRLMSKRKGVREGLKGRIGDREALLTIGE